MVSPTLKRDARLIRRVKFYNRMGMFSSQDSGFEITRAQDVEDLAEAYALVHDAYVSCGYINQRERGLRVRPYEAMPEMATFVARAEGHVVAVTSVLMDSAELGLPSDHAFGQELGRLRGQGRRVCEITNLAVHPDYRRSPVFGELTRCCLAHATAIGYDDMFIAVSPEHANFFGDVLLFEPCGPERNCSDEVEDIVVGMRLNLVGLQDRAIQRDNVIGDLAFLEDFYYSGNPYHALVKRWAVRAAALFTRPQPLRELLIVKGQLPLYATQRELAGLRRRWGQDFYERVMGPGESTRETSAVSKDWCYASNPTAA
jgi:ribosomal protein S18 acetylase RimI-like enzyme